MGHSAISLSRRLSSLVLGVTVCGALASHKHPLCKVLESDHEDQPLGTFPAVYFCHHAGEHVLCSTPDIGAVADATSLSEVGSEMVDTAPFVGTGNSQPTTWWVCEGDRQNRGVQGSVSVDCDAHFAFRVDVDDDLLDYCGQPDYQTASPIIGSETRTGANPVTWGGVARTAAENKNLRGMGHPTTPTDQSAQRETARALSVETDSFVRTAQGQACDERWTSWPALHASGLAGDNVLLYRIYSSVGNLFITLAHMMQVSLLLEVALVLDYQAFPGFRVAFDPSQVMWDVEPLKIKQVANDVSAGGASSGLHALKFTDGVLLLSESRLLLLATKLNLLGDTIVKTAAAVEAAGFPTLRALAASFAESSGRPDTCAWNLLLKRSPSMVRSMADHSPWLLAEGASLDTIQSAKYVAWHIRTSAGETTDSFKSDVHRYVFNKKHSESVFPLFLQATGSAVEECPSAFPGGAHNMPIYISSNSNAMARNCSIHVREQGAVPGFVDLGVAEEDSHTAFSTDPNTAMNAFIDYLYLMDADLIVRSGSSFSGTVVDIKGMNCHRALPGVDIPVSRILVCLPKQC